MASTSIYHHLVFYLAVTGVFSFPQDQNNTGRKLFGGYRIVPKVCQPTTQSNLKSNEPPICMFNYECNRRNGEVVGACMDGFLFGACCQLPPSESTLRPTGIFHTAYTSSYEEIQKIDHVPEVPILLKPDGTPLDDQFSTKKTTPSVSYTTNQIAELEEKFPQLLGQQGILDDLSLPGLLTSSNHNVIQDHQDGEVPSPVTTLLSPDQVMQIADPVDQLPALFSQGIGQNNHTGAETVLLNQNGTIMENDNVSFEQLFRPVNRSTASPYTFVTERTSATTKEMTRPIQYVSTHKITSATEPSTVGLVRVPTISYDTQSSSTKLDNTLDREEIAINHIISILNGSNPSAPADPPRTTTQRVQSSDSTSAVHTWVTVEDTSLPTTNSDTFPYTFYKPSTKPANFYYYDTSSSTASFKKDTTKPPSSTTYGSTFSGGSTYSTRPTTNPPAPTVIVLGPLGTEFTTVTTPKPLTRKPVITPSSIKPTIVTKQPSVGTTITHNISTVISSSPSSSGTSSVISTSYINVNLEDKPSSPTTVVEVITKKPTVWTTVSTWKPSNKPTVKPSFQLRPGKPDFDWPNDVKLTQVQTVDVETTEKPVIVSSPTTNCDDVTAKPDDLSAFPPDRNPSLTDAEASAQQEKPTIVEGFNNTGFPGIELVSDNDIPTPSFIEDDVLKNKVDDFVKKIVNSLKGDFTNLKDVVYRRKNATLATTPAPTKKPTSVKRPTTKPGQTTTKRPTKRPASTKPGISTAKPVKLKPSIASTTKKPSATKRPRPTKKTTTPGPPSVTTAIPSAAPHTAPTTQRPTTTPDYRTQCGVRPLIHDREGRIVGGKSATFGEWPWQVLVRESSWLGLMTKNKCGGVLITEKFVITAAHCQPGFLAALVAVFGEFDISGELEPRRSISKNVQRVIVNRGYNPATFENDLALLELESPVQFDQHIMPICMPPDDADFTGQMATVTGWGRVKYNGGVPSLLQEVQVPVMDNPSCQKLFHEAKYHHKEILPSFLCAGYATGGKDSCEGDSGGPLQIEGPDGKWTLIGTVSHGINCAAPFLPGVYMRTTWFKPWLHTITGV